MTTKYTRLFQKTLAGGALAIALGASAVAFADSHQARGHERGHSGLIWGSPMQAARAAQRLGLTDTQRAELDSIADAARVEMRPLVTAAMQARKEMRTLMQAEEFDEAKLRAAAEKSAAARVEMTVAKARLRARINAVLTPEQRETLAKTSKGRRDKGGRGHHKGYRHHGEGHHRMGGMREGRHHGQGRHRMGGDGEARHHGYGMGPPRDGVTEQSQ